jgi:hypothetical protein
LVALTVATDLLSGITFPSDRTFNGKRMVFEEGVLQWASKEATDEILSRIKGAGFTAFAPIVWHGRGTTWPSKYAEWDFWLKSQPKENFDPLRYLIDRAHQMGIEVHPWFNLALREGDYLPEFAPPGTPERAFDVHNSQFRHLMANLIAEVVSRYDVDGINLDIVRTMGLCTSDFCKADYEKRYGRNLLKDTAQFRLTFGRVPTLVEYQESDVTAMVREISQRVRAIKPHILISADAIPLIASADQGQNSIDWENQGLVDVLFRMDYYRSVDFQLTDKIRSRLKNQNALTLLISNVSGSEEMRPGQKHFARDGQWLAETVSAITRRYPKTGIGVYMYRYLSDEQIASLKTGPFQSPLIQPPEPIKVE